MIGNLLLIGMGGFIGSICRYLLSLFVLIKFNHPFPFGTILVNLTGCLFIGLVYGLAEKFKITDQWQLLIGTGLLGGFTTFSAFSYESIGLLRTEQYVWFGVYLFVSVIVGLILTAIGFNVSR